MIGFLSLFKVGITSNYIRGFSLLLLFFFTISDYIDKITGEDIYEQNVEDYFDTSRLVRLFSIMIALLFVVILMINVVRIVFKYFNYKITRQKGSLLLSFGLLNTKSTIIKPEKVQITTITQNYFQKKMNILELKIKQATGGETGGSNSIIEIPGCSSTERDEILELLYLEIPKKGILLEPNFRKLGFALFLFIGIPLFCFYFTRTYLLSQLAIVDFIVVAYVCFVGVIQFFKFRNYKIFINDHFIIKQSGAWDIKEEIIEPSKIQALSTSQLFWHKKLNIGTIRIHTAGGDISFQLGNYSKIKEYVNLWLYEIEISDRNWM